MALSTDLASRWSDEILINASNPQNSTATTIDTTRRDAAIADVEAAFQVYAGITYDSTVATHTLFGTTGALIRMLVFTGQAASDAWDSWVSSLRDLAMVTSRDRIKMTTDSLLNATGDRANDRPSFDRNVFRGGIIPNSPSGGDGTSNESGLTTTD